MVLLELWDIRIASFKFLRQASPRLPHQDLLSDSFAPNANGEFSGLRYCRHLTSGASALVPVYKQPFPRAFHLLPTHTHSNPHPHLILTDSLLELCQSSTSCLHYIHLLYNTKTLHRHLKMSHPSPNSSSANGPPSSPFEGTNPTVYSPDNERKPHHRRQLTAIPIGKQAAKKFLPEPPAYVEGAFVDELDEFVNTFVSRYLYVEGGHDAEHLKFLVQNQMKRVSVVPFLHHASH